MSVAKNSSGAKNPSRIRLIVLDAELGDGDIGQITQAITNALRPPMANANAVVKRIAAPAPQPNGEDVEVIDVVELEGEEIETVNARAAAPRPKTQRRVGPKPNIIDIDRDSDPPLSSLGKPKSHHKRYLAIARWFHDHRATPVITVDHIFTCYRHLGWPSGIADFAQPFRELKHLQYFTQPETGKYAINQLGIQKAIEAAEAGE
jgi:hypothetical protein